MFIQYCDLLPTLEPQEVTRLPLVLRYMHAQRMLYISKITHNIFDLLSKVSIGDTYDEFVLSDGGQMGEYYNYLLNAVFTDSQVPGAQAFRFVTWLLEQGADPEYMAL